jgi:PEGA domain-containing protein
MLKGTKDEITVVSDPSGAQVTVNENQEGPTPITFTVPSKQDLNITVAKAGYQPEDLQDPASFRWGYEAWAFIAYIIPMVVDLSDGAAWGHDHLTMTAHLEPNGQATSAAAAAVPSPAAGAPLAASAASDAEASPGAAPSPAGRIEAIAVAPVPSPAAAPSASAARQPASSTAPSLPE